MTCSERWFSNCPLAGDSYGPHAPPKPAKMNKKFCHRALPDYYHTRKVPPHLCSPAKDTTKDGVRKHYHPQSCSTGDSMTMRFLLTAQTFRGTQHHIVAHAHILQVTFSHSLAHFSRLIFTFSFSWLSANHSSVCHIGCQLCKNDSSHLFTLWFYCISGQ